MTATTPKTPGTWSEATGKAVKWPEAVGGWSAAATPILEKVAHHYNGIITYTELADAVTSPRGIESRWVSTPSGGGSSRCPRLDWRSPFGCERGASAGEWAWVGEAEAGVAGDPFCQGGGEDTDLCLMASPRVGATVPRATSLRAGPDGRNLRILPGGSDIRSDPGMMSVI